MKAWARCGICPLNPNIFSDADFALSAGTFTKGHVPHSYLAESYSEDSDLGRDEDECVEDTELNDEDEDGSESEHETEGATNHNTSAKDAPFKIPWNHTEKHTQYPSDSISHYSSATSHSCSHQLPITQGKQKHADVEAENIIL